MRAVGFLIAILAAGCASAAPTLSRNVGPDHVYVYGDSQNVNYQCTIYSAYFETGPYGYFFADQCVQTSSDETVWPQFGDIEIYVSMDFLASKINSIQGYCRFVAHAKTQNTSTSTVIDCRTTEAMPAAR